MRSDADLINGFTSGVVLDVFSRWIWVIAFLGLGQQFLNWTNRVLSYLSEAIYPHYILHYLIPGLIGYYIAGLGWPVELKYLTILSLTVVASLLAYEFLGKWTNVTRFLFGMKPKRASTPRNVSANELGESELAWACSTKRRRSTQLVNRIV